MDILIADASNLIHRAYFARLGPAKIPPKPEEVITTVVRMIEGQARSYAVERAQCIVVYDGGGTSGRSVIYPDYKAGRAEKSPELIAALKLAHGSLTNIGMCEIEVAGYEADDTMATYAGLLLAEGHSALLYTSDKDLLQVIGDRCKVIQPTSGAKRGQPTGNGVNVKEWTPTSFAEEMGFPHTLVPDFKALCGDKVDNLPGVPGIGEGYAKKLLQQFGGIEGIIGEGAVPSSLRSLVTAVQANQGQVLVNRMLATLVEVPGLTGEAARWS